METRAVPVNPAPEAHGPARTVGRPGTRLAGPEEACSAEGWGPLMCGIVGLLDPRRRDDADALASLVDGMAAAMVPRGPDGAGRWIDADAGVALGHRRLSVIDLSEHGAQPMSSADGRWVLIYNGEIYNHAELAAELDAGGLVRRGHSDSEVLVEALARWGVDGTLERVDGMFAFAAWDRAERRMTLARDRLGEKPLCYGTLGDGTVVFASTLDALRAHPRFDRPVDRDALALFFRYKYVPAPWSIFTGIAKVEPGGVVHIDGDGTVGACRRYWDLLALADAVPAFTGSAEDAVEELDRLLRRSVADRLVADVPVGAFLSGGIDSSSVVALAQQVSQRPVRTFTIGSHDRDFDESADARAVARHLGTDHTELIVTAEDALAVVDRLGAMYDEPFADSSQVPTWLVSELARRHVTVALSGDGGDELFAGYNRHVWVPAIWSRLSRVPLTARRAGAAAACRVPPRVWDAGGRAIPTRWRPRQIGLKVAKVAGVADAGSAEEVYGRLVSHWTDPAGLVPGSRLPPTVHDDASAWPRTGGLVAQMTAVDAVTYLPDDVLVKVDRAAMAVSLETRVPLLARSVVEFALSLPVSMKLHDGTSKWVLRQVLSRYVPDALVDRPKSGFGVPIGTWLRGELSDWAEDLLTGPEAAAFLDPEVARREWDAHLAGRADRTYELWDVLMFAAWARERGLRG